MKKIIFTILAVAVLTLVSCEKGLDIMSIDANALDNTEAKCWKYTVKNAGIMNGEMYAWDTERNLVVLLQELYKTSGNKAIISYETTPADDENSCNSKNDWAQ